MPNEIPATLEDALKANKSLQTIIDNLQAKLESANTQIANLNKKADGLSGQIADLRQTIKDGSKENAELRATASQAVPKVTDKEKKIQARMAEGRISREAATMAVEHQEIEDGKRAKKKKTN